MIARKFPLPADLQYVLDGACEEHELLSHHHFALTRYADTRLLDDAANREPDLSGRFRLSARRAMAISIAAYADEIIDQMPDEERAHCSTLGYAHMRKAIDDYADHLSDWNYTDVIKGGCAIGMHYRRIKRDQSGTKGAMRVLYAPSAIRRYVRREIGQLDHIKELFRTTLRLPLPSSLQTGDNYLHLMDQHLRAQREAQYAEMARIREMHKTTPYKIAKKAREHRKITTKAAVMAVALVGTSAVSAFARGERVHIHGQEVDFAVRASGNMSAIGHGGVRVEILDKTGARLSNLCVYHEDTPALDQLTAFALRIQSGQERDIIETGNLFGVEAAALDNPVLKDRAKARAPADETDIFPRDHNLFRLHLLAYQSDTLPLYRETVAVHLLGRRASEIMRLK